MRHELQVTRLGTADVESLVDTLTSQFSEVAELLKDAPGGSASLPGGGGGGSGDVAAADDDGQDDTPPPPPPPPPAFAPAATAGGPGWQPSGSHQNGQVHVQTNAPPGAVPSDDRPVPKPRPRPRLSSAATADSPGAPTPTPTPAPLRSPGRAGTTPPGRAGTTPPGRAGTTPPVARPRSRPSSVDRLQGSDAPAPTAETVATAAAAATRTSQQAQPNETKAPQRASNDKRAAKSPNRSSKTSFSAPASPPKPPSLTSPAAPGAGARRTSAAAKHGKKARDLAFAPGNAAKKRPHPFLDAKSKTAAAARASKTPLQGRAGRRSSIENAGASTASERVSSGGGRKGSTPSLIVVGSGPPQSVSTANPATASGKARVGSAGSARARRRGSSSSSSGGGGGGGGGGVDSTAGTSAGTDVVFHSAQSATAHRAISSDVEDAFLASRQDKGASVLPGGVLADEDHGMQAALASVGAWLPRVLVARNPAWTPSLVRVAHRASPAARPSRERGRCGHRHTWSL